MNEKGAVKWWNEDAEESFKQSVTKQLYGPYLFEREEGEHYTFQRQDTGDSIALRVTDIRTQSFEPFVIGQAEKIPVPRIYPRTVTISHCEAIDPNWFEDRQLNQIKNTVGQGATKLAQRANQAYADVLMLAVAGREKIRVGNVPIDRFLAQIGDDLTKVGFNADKFLFPRRFRHQMLSRGIIIADNEIQSSHYVGKTATGLYAFWSEEIPVDIAFVFDGTAAVSLSEASQFYVDNRSAPFSPAVCGVLRLNPIIKNTKSVIAVEGIADSLATDSKAPEVDLRTSDADVSFNKIKREIESSLISQAFRDVALYDLEQARINYTSRAFKSCIVMLGATLEGLILGTLQRTEVISRLQADTSAPKALKDLGLQDPNLSEKIAERLDLEDYKNIIHHLIPDIDRDKVESIQRFRNTVHPWRSVKEPGVYADHAREPARAMNYIGSMEILTNRILTWQP